MFESALLLLGIDDLAKYRVVQMVCSRPEFQGTVESFATELGFRSVDRTAAALDALTASRLLERVSDDRGRLLYCLVRHPGRRQALADLGFGDGAWIEDPSLIERLAKLSLRQVRQDRRDTGAADLGQREVVADGASPG